MTFALHLEIAGLCLLVRRSSELLILLPKTPPDTPTHKHKHHAVIASHKSYQPERQADQGYEEHGLFVHPLGDDVDFAAEPELKYLRFGLEKYEVHDISGCAKGNVDPTKAFIRIHMPYGAPFTKHGGASWKPDGNSSALVPMATRLTWSIRGLRNQVDSKPGMKIRITPSNGSAYDVILRPGGDRVVRMSLYHTLAVELPGKPHPGQPAIAIGEKAEHFHHFFELLNGEPCKDKEPVFGHASPLLTPPVAGSKAPQNLDRNKFHEDSGRRYSCLLATTEE